MFSALCPDNNDLNPEPTVSKPQSEVEFVTVDQSSVCYLCRIFNLVVVVVAGQSDVFMNPVQQPQEKLQGVVLSVTTELGAILGDCSLKGRRQKKEEVCSTLLTDCTG